VLRQRIDRFQKASLKLYEEAMEQALSFLEASAPRLQVLNPSTELTPYSDSGYYGFYPFFSSGTLKVHAPMLQNPTA
jgi:hypothetical protein